MSNERYATSHLITSCHINKLLELEPINRANETNLCGCINTYIVAWENYEYLKRELKPVKSKQPYTEGVLYVSTKI